MPLYISIGSSVIEDIVAMREIIFSPKLRPYTENQEDQAHFGKVFSEVLVMSPTQRIYLYF